MKKEKRNIFMGNFNKLFQNFVAKLFIKVLGVLENCVSSVLSLFKDASAIVPSASTALYIRLNNYIIFCL